MFKIGSKDQYSWPVKVELAADGGKTEKQTFDAVFKRLPQSEVESLGDKLRNDEIKEAALIEEILVGWKGVQDSDGNDLPFSETNRDFLMDVFPVRGCVITAWLESLKVGRAKN